MVEHDNQWGRRGWNMNDEAWGSYEGEDAKMEGVA